MERGAALTKIRKILGPKFNYRVDPKALNREGKEAAEEELKPLEAESSRLEKLKNERYRVVLEADKEYQDLRIAWMAAKNAAADVRSKLYHDKINVGVVHGMFNFIKASGDNWEEVIAKLQKKS